MAKAVAVRRQPGRGRAAGDRRDGGSRARRAATCSCAASSGGARRRAARSRASASRSTALDGLTLDGALGSTGVTAARPDRPRVVVFFVVLFASARSRSRASTSAGSSSGSAGCCREPKGPGLFILIPIVDRMVTRRPAHDHAQHPAAGSDHEGQRARCA